MSKLRQGESITDGKLHLIESYVIRPMIDNKESSQKVVTEATEQSRKLVLRPRIEAIHAGRTRNDNIYPSERLRGDRSFTDPTSGKQMPSGVHSFTLPYPKPMITDHYPSADNVTGRITNAQFIRDVITNKDVIVIIPEIVSQDAIEKVLDGRYMTVSIGATTDSAICNICGKDIINEGWCEHEKGKEYDGVRCGWIVGNIWFDECSWVPVPADTDAKVIDPGEVQTVEAYASVEDSFYDLSHGASIVTESVANTLGLVISTEQLEGGLDAVGKANENTVTIEEFNAMKEKADKVAGLEETITGLNSTIAEKDTEIQTLKDSVTATDTVIAEKDTAIAEKETKLQEQATTISTLEADKNQLDAKVKDLEAEKQSLVDQNTEMAANAHRDLVDRVVDLKIALGKPGIENREQAISDHTERATESLKDSYVDLLSELTKGKSQFIPGKVSNPGIGVVLGEKNSTIEGNDDGAQLDELDTEKVLKYLFSGKLGRK